MRLDEKTVKFTNQEGHEPNFEQTQNLIASDKEGEICISGPSVFSGYLDVLKDPFIELEGKQWYRSGDRGYIESDGTLVLTGRLKRFVKLGAEMVSLGGLEEDILQIGKNKALIKEVEGATVAVVASGRESEKPQLILFVIFPIEREDLNSALKQMGHGRLIKFSEVRQLEEIPLTGTGKVHYRMLEEML